MNPKVDSYIAKSSKWQAELELLQQIILDCGLTEELKWRVPCYMWGDTNIILLGTFKEFCSISFIKGVLLADVKKVLVSPGENSQSVRLIKYIDAAQIKKHKDLLKAYIFEAIAVEEAGLKVDKTASTEFELVAELTAVFKTNKAFKSAFEALTIGRQRAYNIHFTSSKVAKTRLARIENYMPRIMAGKGINDCVCGHSQKKPGCDGSHKLLPNYVKPY